MPVSTRFSNNPIVKLPPLKVPNDVITVSGGISVEYWTITGQDILMLTLDVIVIVRIYILPWENPNEVLIFNKIHLF